MKTSKFNKIKFFIASSLIISCFRAAIAYADIQTIDDCKQTVADSQQEVQELNVYYFRLALCEAEFIHNEKTFNHVIDLFKKSAVKTSISFEPQAYYALAFLYENKYQDGQALYGVPGVQSDLTQAIYYYEKTAALGCSLAQYKLAMIYLPHKTAKLQDLSSSSEPGDLNRGMTWLLQAAKAGNAAAQAKLSELYQQGMGTLLPQDFLQAYLWQSMAIATQQRYNKMLVDSPVGQSFLNTLKEKRQAIERKLTPEQKLKAKTLLPKYYSQYLKPPSSVEESCEHMQSLLTGNTLRNVLKTLNTKKKN